MEEGEAEEAIGYGEKEENEEGGDAKINLSVNTSEEAAEEKITLNMHKKLP